MIGPLEQWNESLEKEGELPIDFVTGFRQLGDQLIFIGIRDRMTYLRYSIYSVEFDPQPSLPGDLEGDGDVDLDDFLILAHNFGKTSDTRVEEGDLDGDDDIDFDDFVILAENFGRKLND